VISNRSVPASSVIPVLAYGERQYSAEDLGGHHWVLSQSIADVDPASWGATRINIG
jgi:hypothetical protein